MQRLRSFSAVIFLNGFLCIVERVAGDLQRKQHALFSGLGFGAGSQFLFSDQLACRAMLVMAMRRVDSYRVPSNRWLACATGLLTSNNLARHTRRLNHRLNAIANLSN